jgi:hypothetical protein
MNIPLGISGFYDLAAPQRPHGFSYAVWPRQEPHHGQRLRRPGALCLCQVLRGHRRRHGPHGGEGGGYETGGVRREKHDLCDRRQHDQWHQLSERGGGRLHGARTLRTFLAYQNRSGAAVAIGELGVSWENVDNPTLFSRIVLTDVVSVPDGFDLLVRYTLRFQLPKDIFALEDDDPQNRVGGRGGKLTMAAYYYKTDSSVYFGLSCINADGTSANVLTGTGTDAGRAIRILASWSRRR